MNPTSEQIDRILRVSRASDNAVILPFGSRVYGNHTYQSDYDYYVIDKSMENSREIRNGDLNLHTYTPEFYQDLLNRHKVGAIETYFVDLYNENRFQFKLDLSKLRREFSATASNSWVKAKKKIAVEHELYIGKKSLWHSLRIVKFGIQIAKSEVLTDFSCYNDMWDEIYQHDYFMYDWSLYDMKYRSVKHSLDSRFRELAPK